MPLQNSMRRQIYALERDYEESFLLDAGDPMQTSVLLHH